MPRKEISLIVQDLAFYWTGRADVGRFDTARHPWGYAPDWEFQLAREAAYFDPKDAEGIPVRRYPSLGDQYLISRIATYGLAHWNRWTLDGNAHSRGEFLRICDWLLRAGDGRYEHRFAVAGMPVPWISCISQGEAASALARAFVLTGDERYRAAAERSARWFLVDVADGGLRSRMPDGQPFLEEYPGTHIQHVLNGCLYAMIGLHDVARIADDAAVWRDAFDALVASVATHLPAWDVDGWSRYDYPAPGERGRQNLNTMTYQILQTALLGHLAMVSGDTTLATYAARWDRSSRSLAKRLSALASKTAYRLTSGW